MSGRETIQQWWTQTPMTYALEHGGSRYAEGAYPVGSPAFFRRLDEELFKWNAPLHTDVPFGAIFPYSRYAGEAVLEVGCGLGTMAMLWAGQAARVTAVDLSPRAVALSRSRFEQQGLEGRFGIATAHSLPFADQVFAYAYSWGVLHHSPDLKRSVAELMRVLKPGGEFGIMLYNRHSLLYGYLIRYVEGFLHNEARFLSPLELASRYGDGARQEGNPHTWPVSRREMEALLRPYCRQLHIRCFGTDLDSLLPLMLPGLGGRLPAWAVKPWARRFGWSLWMTGVRQ